MNKRKFSSLIIGLIILSVFLTMAIFPSIFTSYGRKEMFEAWLKPCSKHILGTNSLGYDIFTETVYAARDTLFVGLASAIVSIFIAIVFSALSSGNDFLGSIFGGLTRIFLMLPKLVCLIVFSAFIGNNSLALIALISAFSWAQSSRVLEDKTKAIKEKPFIENLKIQGFSNAHIAIYHILPNLFDVIVSRFILGLNSCIMMESTLSFLGIGNTYYPTWGSMINFAYNKGALLREAYAYILAPGLCIMLVALAFHLIISYIESRKEEIDS